MGELFHQFAREGGSFTRPDWRAFWKWLDEQGPRSASDREDLVAEVTRDWAACLAEELGGNYRVHETKHYLCIAELPEAEVARALRFAEHAETRVHDFLGDVAWRGHARHLLLLIHEEDDYDSYVAQFYDEGTYSASIGIAINDGYPHIAVHFVDWHQALKTLVHELSHACVTHLNLPRWLDEGIAQTIEKRVGDVPPPEYMTDAEAIWSIQSGWIPPVMWGELAERHHEFWNEENIQSFWAGTIFSEPGDATELSYSLAEVLVNLIAQDFGNWLDFVSRAQWGDSGQTAALDCFGTGLGEIAGTFLGPGEWRPVRKRMVERWREAGWEKAEPSSE